MLILPIEHTTVNLYNQELYEITECFGYFMKYPIHSYFCVMTCKAYTTCKK